MPLADEKYFDCLKKEISEKLRASHPGVNSDVTQWKGEDIVKFQEDLIRIANGRISEKWFYTHIKSPNGHLPRIDILNLLSRYAGHRDWSSFKGSKTEKGEVEETKKIFPLKKTGIALIIIIIVFMVTFFVMPNQPKSYSFCLISAFSKEPLRKGEVEVIVLNDSESPYTILPNSTGCVDFTVNQGSVKFIIKGAYYKTDTIFRKFNKQQVHEVISVKVNDYAMMLHLFSQGNIKDWERRRAQLNNMFLDDAQIFQIMEGQGIGMEMYNKDEFINKLTMPLSSLKNIEIIETLFEGKRIKELRFKQENK